MVWCVSGLECEMIQHRCAYLQQGHGVLQCVSSSKFSYLLSFHLQGERERDITSLICAVQRPGAGEGRCRGRVVWYTLFWRYVYMYVRLELENTYSLDV